MARVGIYKSYPSDYVRWLKQNGKRKKASAFMEYFDDSENNEHFSISFYANSWGVSKSTAWHWIQEFKQEINKFNIYWDLKNKQKSSQNSPQNNSSKTSQKKFVRTQTERQSNDLENHNTSKAPENSSICDLRKNLAERQPNEVYNIYDDDNKDDSLRDKHFYDLFFIYRQNYKFAGKRENAYQEYKKIKETIDYEQLKRAIIFYLHDPEIEKRYNFANFLKNQVYLYYIPKKLKVKIKDEWKIGTYNDKEQVFQANDGYIGLLTPERLAELFAKGELEFEMSESVGVGDE